MEIPPTPGSYLSPADTRLLQCRVPRSSWWRGCWARTLSRHTGTGTYGQPHGSAQRTVPQQHHRRKHTLHSTNTNSTEASPVPPLQLSGWNPLVEYVHAVWVSPVAVLSQQHWDLWAPWADNLSLPWLALRPFKSISQSNYMFAGCHIHKLKIQSATTQSVAINRI